MPDWLLWVIVAVVLILVFQNPAGAGHFVNQVITAALTFARST